MFSTNPLVSKSVVTSGNEWVETERVRDKKRHAEVNKEQKNVKSKIIIKKNTKHATDKQMLQKQTADANRRRRRRRRRTRRRSYNACKQGNVFQVQREKEER